MTKTVILHPRFSKLNGGGVDLLVKQNTPNRERRAVCLVSFVDETATTGGIFIDFSVIRKFKEVYAANIISVTANDFTLIFAPDQSTNNNAASGKIRLFNKDTGAEIVSGDQTFESVIEIYGI